MAIRRLAITSIKSSTSLDTIVSIILIFVLLKEKIINQIKKKFINIETKFFFIVKMWLEYKLLKNYETLLTKRLL